MLYMHVTLLVAMTRVNVGKMPENLASLRLSQTKFTLVKCAQFHIHGAVQCFCMQTCSGF